MPNCNLIKFAKRNWALLLVLLFFIALGGVALYHSNIDIFDLLGRFGYAAIVGLTFLEGETIVILAGVFSKRLGLAPELIAVAAFCGSFASDQLMFSLGKYKGDSMLRRFPRLGSNIDRAAKLFKKYDTALILGFRFVYGVRNVTPILLGISGVSHKKFFFLNFIGAAVWAISFTYGGLYLGQAFVRAVGHFGKGFLIFLALLVVIGGLVWFIRARSTVKHHQNVVTKQNNICAGHESTHPVETIEQNHKEI